MKKNKLQLRAEAVERLKELGKYPQASDIQWGLFGSGKDNMPPDKLRDELVSLLTDDTHESRGSYEERLYDVPVSDCPYCGCKRVVIHDFSDIYEEPHSYRVEHVDEKDAFNAGCFETYYSFDSAEKAVKHANMRDRLVDGEKEADVGESTQDGEGDKSYRLEKLKTSNEKLKAADKVLSLLTGNERVFADDEPDDEERDAREKPDAQSRAEIEDAERSANAAESHGDAERAVLSADTDTDKGEGAKGAQDTREKLEADVRDHAPINGVQPIVVAGLSDISDWLDRQAAITERECREYEDALREQHHKRIAELNEQLESAHAKNRSLKAHIAKMQEGRHGWHVKYPKLQKKNAELQAKVDELTAERDQYRDNMLAQAQIAGEALAERDMYRENLEAESNRTCTLAYDGKWLVCSECGESLQWFGVRTIYKDGTQERALGVDGVKYCAFCGARIEVDE